MDLVIKRDAEFRDEICIVCGEPIGDEPHDGRMKYEKGERHWRCRPNADDPIANMSFSEAMEGLRELAKTIPDDQLKMVNDRLRKITK